MKTIADYDTPAECLEAHRPRVAVTFAIMADHFAAGVFVSGEILTAQGYILSAERLKNDWIRIVFENGSHTGRPSTKIKIFD